MNMVPVQIDKSKSAVCIPNPDNSMKFIFHAPYHIFMEIIRKREFVILEIV